MNGNGELCQDDVAMNAKQNIWKKEIEKPHDEKIFLFIIITQLYQQAWCLAHEHFNRFYFNIFLLFIVEIICTMQLYIDHITYGYYSITEESSIN